MNTCPPSSCSEVREQLSMLLYGELSFDAGELAQRVRDRPGRHCDEDDVRVGRVATVTAERRHLVPRLPPETAEATADVPSADGYTVINRSSFEETRGP